MKRLKKLRLRTDQLLSSKEEDYVLAGGKTLVCYIENCNCKKPGDSHKQILTYECTPDSSSIVSFIADIGSLGRMAMDLASMIPHTETVTRKADYVSYKENGHVYYKHVYGDATSIISY